MSKLSFYCYVHCKLLISIDNLDIIFIYQFRRHFLYKILGYYIFLFPRVVLELIPLISFLLLLMITNCL
ncbi:hypothetical protein C1645_768546 [Glomus cerebriforme]|uniref:Uncharacterized protein n=1 Tax=Glomus cerebriforme TaxID=658196 RepID=A0A397T3U7_9GLOM|nr:hypothetical protein C1645_768546 [Glomus cerebriforme]